MLRYWEVVDGDGVIVAAGLDDSKHQGVRQTPKDDDSPKLLDHRRENHAQHPAKKATSDS